MLTQLITVSLTPIFLSKIIINRLVKLRWGDFDISQSRGIVINLAFSFRGVTSCTKNAEKHAIPSNIVLLVTMTKPQNSHKSHDTNVRRTPTTTTVAEQRRQQLQQGCNGLKFFTRTDYNVHQHAWAWSRKFFDFFLFRCQFSRSSPSSFA